MTDQKVVKCPRCGQPSVFSATNPHRPFCSERCQLMDLGKWAQEGFRIPGEDVKIPSDVNENKSQSEEEEDEDEEK